ncbi:MAG TPA: superoxide dismutase family protein [Azospirillum sp.]|nr:superoxide dismutase family protein [Azospirillum sp.]
MRLSLPVAGILLAMLTAPSPAPAQGQSTSGQGAPLPAPPSGQPLATANLIGANGQPLGTAAFIGTPNGVLIQLRAETVPPGVHGLHIHEAGQCQPPDFRSAGGHFNPGGAVHGFLAPQGHHVGDLPNVFAHRNGDVWADIRTDLVTLGTGAASLFPANGTALVLHAGPDDYKTDPAGAAGDRIACGVIVRTTQPR